MARISFGALAPWQTQQSGVAALAASGGAGIRAEIEDGAQSNGCPGGCRRGYCLDLVFVIKKPVGVREATRLPSDERGRQQERGPRARSRDRDRRAECVRQASSAADPE